MSNLRALFRLLDEEGAGEISALEIRRGLLLLGFPEAADPVALSRVVGDIDEDNTGTITESEFLAFFGAHDRASIGELLNNYVLDHTYIVATTYGQLISITHLYPIRFLQAYDEPLAHLLEPGL